MIFVGSAPIDEDDIILAESKPYGNSHTSVGIDFGGDEVIDGAPSVENIFDNINDEPIKLSQISEDELDADMQGILPEKAEEVIQEEIALPYVFPPVDKLSLNKNAADPNMQAELQENAKILKDTLKSFNVQIREINYSRGPTVTRYELKPEVGTKVKSIANLVDDIALNLATSGVRIEAPIPNKPAVGIEVPNRHPEIVYLRDLIESPKFTESKSRVTACLGKDIGGNPICFDIAKMPHLLIAGATGMGKSVCINCIIISLLYKARPEEVKLILIDPKKVEFAMYKDIPHLYAPIVSDPKKAAGALASAVVEMERRFELIENAGVRNIDGYNETIADDPTQQKLPQIVIVIDELADLMMTAGKEVESCICRLAQKARAAGIHLIIGTQRPSVDVITGLIKANIPSRIACTVASQIDSRTILDMAGAEKLIGRGDMLFAPVGASKPMRVQGAFVSDSEVEDIVSFVKANNSSAKYDSSFISTMESSAKSIGAKKGDIISEDTEDSSFSSGDSKFEEAVRIAIESGKISTSLLQRRLGIGYGRAAKLIDLMEDKGYVGAANGTKPREVLISMNEFLERKASGDIDDEE
jgi:S-DNA-T family DNA segregation ATPase FtsK/SpoIIIE